MLLYFENTRGLVFKFGTENDLEVTNDIFFNSLWTAFVLSSLDSSIVAAVYPRIGTEFKK